MKGETEHEWGNLHHRKIEQSEVKKIKKHMVSFTKHSYRCMREKTKHEQIIIRQNFYSTYIYEKKNIV